MAFSGRIRRELKTTEVPIDDASSAADRVLSASYIKGQLSAKADKAQEEWITPTLLNGATQVSGYPVGIMKDSMGFVHFKGRINIPSLNTIIFKLPAGYRLITDAYMHFSIASNNAFGQLWVGNNISDNMVVVSTGAITNISLNGISFKAEA